MVINSIEVESGTNRVDVTSRPDGQFTFKIFRKDPEDQGRWTLVSDYSGLQFGTEEQALWQAAAKIPWLAERLLLSEAGQRKTLMTEQGNSLTLAQGTRWSTFAASRPVQLSALDGSAQ
jgi:hypothetical protein